MGDISKKKKKKKILTKYLKGLLDHKFEKKCYKCMDFSFFLGTDGNCFGVSKAGENRTWWNKGKTVESASC